MWKDNDNLNEIIANGLINLANRIKENKVRIYNSEDLGVYWFFNVIIQRQLDLKWGNFIHIQTKLEVDKSVPQNAQLLWQNDKLRYTIHMILRKGK